MSALRVALLEDDALQADLVKLWLEGAGHVCHVFHLGKDLIRCAPRESFDLFLLDWTLPDMDGTEVLGWLRQHLQQRVPVLFVTARDREEDVVQALTAGADDYMAKPLRKGELLARIRALIRRVPGAPDRSQRFPIGEFEVDAERRTITRDGEPVVLSHREFALALFLFNNLGKLLSRGHIMESVWGRSADINTRTVDTHMSKLRRILQLVPENGWSLAAVYQHGYRLEQIGKPDDGNGKEPAGQGKPG